MKYRPDLVLYFFNKNDPENNITVHKAFRRFGKSWFHLAEDGSLELRGVPVPRFAQAEAIQLDASGEPRRVEVSFGTRLRLWVRDNTAGHSALGAALLHVLALAPELMNPIRELGATDELVPKLGFDRESHVFRLTAAMVGEMRKVSEEGGARFAMIGVRGRWPRNLRDELGLVDLRDFGRFRDSIPDGTMTNVPYDPHLNSIGHELYGKALTEALLEHGLVTP